ncbi:MULTISPECIES: hypothetical protein [Actinobacillus]|uniref:Uncharacterized protein n=1 Tax=Actinobacillus equuli TaxID=718 RepID=A0AAX3FPU4_ACTEU|nr:MULTISPECIES: hypothetical protein [Actinobacillus]AIZ78671.1 hypothetical protein ACEE_02530 [Actinobacillus equuli subsp. equuli]WGE34409.1 hypothetical protein NYR61_02310 [Actinobacillus genomosp. 1]WGE44931.1 hypothetical protein NYR65_02510 [Actinobacillus equuli subsp. equuli]VEE92812.1 Uncharacterised protein [Actinobacillus equuli]
MGNFFKRWYTLEETVCVLNDYFASQNKLNIEPLEYKKLFNIQDVLNFYRGDQLRLAVHIQELDNDKGNINLFDLQITTESFLYDSIDDMEIKGDITITSGDDSVVGLLDDYLYAHGYFCLPRQYTTLENGAFSISAIKIYQEEQMDVTTGDGVDYPFSLNHSFNIAFPYPIIIPMGKIIVLRKDILELITIIEKENRNAKLFIEHNIQAININQTAELERLNSIIKQKNEEIAQLKTENLSKPDTQAVENGGNVANIPVNHDDFSIYGHSSENLKLLFEMTKKIAAKCDPENVYSYPKKEDFINYVRKYLTDNQKLAESLYQIIIPEKVKIRGNTPKGVNTFQGFI